MKEFNITDIVKLKENDKVLFMVVDYADFTKTTDIGEEPIIDIDYEIMQVYPIQKDSKYSNVGQNDLMIHERTGQRNHELLLNFIQKDREKNGWYGVPDFLLIANRNLRAIERERVNKTVGVKEVKPPMQKMDNIRYDMIETIDGCLDALNDLDALYKTFGDDAYLQLKELVTARIIRLNK